MPALATATSQTKNARNKVVRLADVMIGSVDSRLQVAATPSTSMKLFTGVGMGYTGSTYTVNTSNWLHDLRDQLNGFHMRAGAWNQSYGAIPLGDRFLLSCGHNGPGIGNALRYVKADGTVFNTTISKWINDHPAVAQGNVSDTKQAYVADLSIYVTADALPEWVNRAPIINLPASTRTTLAALNAPSIGVTQGNWDAGPAAAYGYYDTPDNRMVRVASLAGLTPVTALRTPFYHYGVVGDSGTPDYALIEDTIYLLRVVLSSGGTGAYVCDYIDYINAMIARGATAAGISPITVSAVTNPIP